MAARYVPDVGDIVWRHFSPHAGQHRPALVLSSARYNALTGLMVCCPMTTKARGYPFEVPIKSIRGGVVLADAVKNLDWRERRAQRKGRATPAELADVRAKLRALLAL